MGIVAKQSVKGSVYSYIGAFIGFINVGLLMPKFFLLEQVGLIGLLISVSVIFSNFSGLGFTTVLNRLFPYFRNDDNRHNGILPLSYLFTLIGVSVSIIVFFLIRSYLVESNSENSALFVDYMYYIPVIFVLAAFYTITDAYNKSLFDATLGIFLREFFVRVSNLIIIILYILQIISFEIFVFAYVIIYTCPLLIMVIVLISRKQFQLTYINWSFFSEYKKEILLLAVFGMIAGFSGTAVVNIDRYMINHYIGLEKTGVYAVSFYFGSVIFLASRALKKISSIIIAEAWKKNDRHTISTLYKKSTLTQFIIALFIFIGVWANLSNIFRIIPNYEEGFYVILLIGGAYVIEMLSGLSDMIIATSKHYKIFSFIMLIKIVLVIVFNIIFIPIWGLTGGALSSFITITLTALIRYLYIYIKFKFQPYGYRHLLILPVAGFSLSIGLLLPEFNNYFLDIIVRSFLITLVYSVLILGGKFSEDVNAVFRTILKKIGL